ADPDLQGHQEARIHRATSIPLRCKDRAVRLDDNPFSPWKREYDARMFNADQRRVLVGVASAVTGCALAFGLGYFFLGGLRPANDDVASRIAFAARWNVVAAIALLIGIGRVGNARFASSEAITGATPEEGPLAI